MFHQIYKNRIVLITGHNGFKGSPPAIWLKELGADIVGYSLTPPREPSNINATRLRGNDPLGGHDPYSASKVCAALVFSAYLKSFIFHCACSGMLYDLKIPRTESQQGRGNILKYEDELQILKKLPVDPHEC